MEFLRRFFGPPSPARFAKMVMSRLRLAGDPRRAEFDEANFRLLLADGDQRVGKVNLRNLYQEFCQLKKADEKRWWSNMLRALLHRMSPPDDFEDARPDLQPIVRTRSYVEGLRLQCELEGAPFEPIPYLSLGDHLVACVVYDLPSSVIFVNQEQLTNWGITFYEALEVALQNLAEQPCQFASLGDSVFMPLGGDAYDATRLLLPELFEKLSLTGDPVAMAVNVHKLILTSAEDDAGLKIMVDLAEKFVPEPRPLSPVPIRMVDGEWETWLPSAQHPEYKRFKLLQLKYLMSEYADQKQQLEAIYQKQGVDVFVATYSAAESDDDAFSYAVWSKNVPTHLPETDEVHFFNPETEAIHRVKWDRVQELVGYLMQSEENRYPPRWFVDGFPSEAELAEMAAV